MILLALPRVIAPLYETAVTELFVNDPALEIPVPFNVSGSAVLNVNPLRSRVAPEVI